MINFFILEIKLFLRNKKTKNDILIFFINYIIIGLIYYIKIINGIESEYNSIVLKNIYSLTIPLFISVFIGGLQNIFGSSFYTFYSSFIDLLLLRKIKHQEFIEGRHFFFIILCLIGYIMALPFTIISNLFLFSISTFVFHATVSYYFIVYTSISNKGRIELNKRNVISLQNFSWGNLYSGISLLIPPVIFYLFEYFSLENLFHLSVIISLAFIVFFNAKIIKKFKKQFWSEKYDLRENMKIRK